MTALTRYQQTQISADLTLRLRVRTDQGNLAVTTKLLSLDWLFAILTSLFGLAAAAAFGLERLARRARQRAVRAAGRYQAGMERLAWTVAVGLAFRRPAAVMVFA